MSETSSRYQNALRYAPGRSVGSYPDSRDITQLPVSQVGSRTPIAYRPNVTQVATTDPVLLAAPPEVVFEDLPAEPLPQTGGDMAEAGTNVLGLIARYGPRIANELMKRLRPDEDALGVLQNPGGLPVVPWGGDQFGYVPQGSHPFGDGGVYWSPQGVPDFNGAIVPGPSATSAWGGAGDFNFVPQGSGPFGGGVYMAPNGSEGLFDGAIVPKEGLTPAAAPTDSSSLGGGFGGALAGVRDALGTSAAFTQLADLGDLSGLATAGLGAVGGWLGSNGAQAAYQNNGTPDNISTGSAIGGVIGSAILPGVGTAIGSFLGGSIGGSINPQPDYKQAFAQFGIGPDGALTGSGIQRNNAGQDVADNLYNNANQYWSDLAAQRGLAPNAGMMNQGFRFGVGQGDNQLGGWFLQPFAGDPNYADVRPDMHLLTQEDPVRRAQVAAEVAATYRPGDNYFFAGPDNAGQRGAEFTRGPSGLQEALDWGFDRLVNLGYYAPTGGGPSPQDIAANIEAQRAWAAANPQMIQVEGEGTSWIAMPWADNFTYQPGWQAPVAQVADAYQPGSPSWADQASVG